MAKEAKKETAQTAPVAPVAPVVPVVKAPKPIQSKDSPPAVADGKKAVWHEAFSYANNKQNVVTVAAHWEVINAPKPKPVAPVAPAPEQKAS